AALRREESRSALRALGAGDAGETRLGLPDGGLTGQWMSGDERLADSLSSALRGFRPTIVSAPSLFDGPPDHSPTARPADVALARFEGSAPQPRLVAYRTHTAGLAPWPTLWLRLTPAARATKLRAIECIPSQLHWRRRELTAFADSVEWFDPPDTLDARRQEHRVRDAWIQGDRVVVDYATGRWPNLGPLVLLVSCDGATGPLARLTVRLPARPGVVPTLDGSGRDGPTFARVWRVADHWRGAVPLPFTTAPLLTYRKVERPAEVGRGLLREFRRGPPGGPDD